MSGKKCKHCGSSEIEVDPARGDAVCTSCGTVLEDNIIVAEVEFQENAHGGSSALGQFVSAETKGGATGFGSAFNCGIGQESREVTIRKAKHGITALCQQLRLNQQCIDIACNFFKLALSRHLTKGRPASHIHAACVYITCRTEGTAHLLIDISDALQICCYQLGRTYLRLSRALCITIPSIDPCLYILRFASQLQFGDNKHDVTVTALRLVQRMKKDSIHLGRRPSGLCGAALLIAARLHNFNRTPKDVVRIVKVHESTLRKRLLEFGDTPSSALTLDEFMTVDLEEEQDPPAFRAARKRDKDRLQKLMEEEDVERELTHLQRLIDLHLEKDTSRKKTPSTPSSSSSILSTAALGLDDPLSEDEEATRFATEDNLEILGNIVKKIEPVKNEKVKKEYLEKGLGPDIAFIGLRHQDDCKDKFLKPEPKFQFEKNLVSADELLMSEKDEQYIDTIIMNEEDATYKTKLWTKLNAGYLKEQKIKEELKIRELEEGKDKKKKIRGAYKKKVPLSAATAGEAIEKMLQEKKMSSKINYDILRSLDQSGGADATSKVDEESRKEDKVDVVPKEDILPAPIVCTSPVPTKRRKRQPVSTLVLPVVSPAPPATPAPPDTPAQPATPAPATPAPETPAPPTPALTDVGEDYEDEIEPVGGEMSLAAMLQNGGQEDDYDDYEEY